jgi:aspartyl-tRNA(Asn)/glutamyl-tRNA(Gln) amidotransferase subunit A
MSGADLHDLPIARLAALMEAGRLSSVELTRHMLARIERHDGVLKSHISLNPQALADARAADSRRRRGQRVGPLLGIPVSVKDNYLSAALPTTAGTLAPGIDFGRSESACVERLLEAGCVVLGKTRTHEFAWGTVTDPVANPWNTDCIPGGSSGGSGSAVAARITCMALGSDTGGSIRIPASLCGTVGIKPTFGRISRHGIVPHSWSLDHPGPLTRTVEDAAITMQALAGYDARDPVCQDQPVPDYRAGLKRGVRGLRIAVIENHFLDRNQPAVQALFDSAIADLERDGATIIRVQVPTLRYGLAAIFAIELASSSAWHDRWVREGVTQHYTPDVRDLVEMGRLVSAVDYLKAEQVRTLLMRELREVLESADVIATPTEPLTAWPKGVWTVDVSGAPESVLAASWRLTYPFNLSGLPAITVPCGFDHGGMPVGLQLAARPFDEAMVLRVAAHYERSHDWLARKPAGFE